MCENKGNILLLFLFGKIDFSVCYPQGPPVNFTLFYSTSIDFPTIFEACMRKYQIQICHNLAVWAYWRNYWILNHHTWNIKSRLFFGCTSFVCNFRCAVYFRINSYRKQYNLIITSFQWYRSFTANQLYNPRSIKY